MFSNVLIPHIILMSISFSFKTNLAVSLVAVAIPAKTDKPFHQIPDVETDEEHLTLLQCVDVFVVSGNGIQLAFSKNYAKKIDGIIFPAYGQPFIPDDYHLITGR